MNQYFVLCRFDVIIWHDTCICKKFKLSVLSCESPRQIYKREESRLAVLCLCICVKHYSLFQLSGNHFYCIVHLYMNTFQFISSRKMFHGLFRKNYFCCSSSITKCFFVPKGYLSTYCGHFGSVAGWSKFQNQGFDFYSFISAFLSVVRACLLVLLLQQLLALMCIKR